MLFDWNVDKSLSIGVESVGLRYLGATVTVVGYYVSACGYPVSHFRDYSGVDHTGIL